MSSTPSPAPVGKNPRKPLWLLIPNDDLIAPGPSLDNNPQQEWLSESQRSLRGPAQCFSWIEDLFSIRGAAVGVITSAEASGPSLSLSWYSSSYLIGGQLSFGHAHTLH